MVTTVALTAFATSAFTALVGFGGGFLMLAVLLLVLDPVAALAIHSLTQLVASLLRLWVWRKDVDRGIVLWSSVLLVPGSALALPLLVRAPAPALQAGIGLTALLATWAPERRDRGARVLEPKGWVALGGVFAVLNTLVGASGILMIPWLKASLPDRRAFVGTFAATQVAAYLVKSAMFGATGLFEGAGGGLATFAVAASILGSMAGSVGLNRLSDANHRRLGLVTVTLAGIYLMGDATTDWLA